LIGKIIDEPNLRIASIEDIACMKLAAIVARATNKDYIDLYFILHEFSLADILKKLAVKIPELDANLVLKSLVYFNDIIIEPIKFKNKCRINFGKVQRFLENQVKSLKD
jgi:predicted nucleotidyltransferase component of viral defense system